MTIAMMMMMMMMFSGLHRELSVSRVWEEDYWSKDISEVTLRIRRHRY